MSKFILKRNESTPGWWTLTCPDYGMEIEFKEHEFNETQRVTFSDEQKVVERLGAQGIAGLMREAGGWLATHAYSIAAPTPVFEFRRDDKADKDYVIRNKFPRLIIDVVDDCSYKQLADALRSAGEYIKRLKGRSESETTSNEEFTISLPGDIAEAIRVFAKQEGVPPGDILTGMIEDYFGDIEEEDEEEGEDDE